MSFTSNGFAPTITANRDRFVPQKSNHHVPRSYSYLHSQARSRANITHHAVGILYGCTHRNARRPGNAQPLSLDLQSQRMYTSEFSTEVCLVCIQSGTVRAATVSCQAGNCTECRTEQYKDLCVVSYLSHAPCSGKQVVHFAFDTRPDTVTGVNMIQETKQVCIKLYQQLSCEQKSFLLL